MDVPDKVLDDNSSWESQQSMINMFPLAFARKSKRQISSIAMSSIQMPGNNYLYFILTLTGLNKDITYQMNDFG